MKFILFLVLSLTTTHNLHARLGETPAQIIQRYGRPIAKGDAYLLGFSFHGYKISVRFSRNANSISVFETFTKEDGDELTNEEIGVILSPNTLGSSWQELPNYDFKVWRLASKSADAWYRREGRNGPTLSFGTDFNIDLRLELEKKSQEAARIREEKEKARREAERLKGF